MQESKPLQQYPKSRQPGGIFVPLLLLPVNRLRIGIKLKTGVIARRVHWSMGRWVIVVNGVDGVNGGTPVIPIIVTRYPVKPARRSAKRTKGNFWKRGGISGTE